MHFSGIWLKMPQKSLDALNPSPTNNAPRDLVLNGYGTADAKGYQARNPLRERSSAVARIEQFTQERHQQLLASVLQLWLPSPEARGCSLCQALKPCGCPGQA
jgi:hypothetical protein